MTVKTSDSNPMISLLFERIRSQTKVGVVVEIGGGVFWVPVSACTWNDTTISMRKSIAVQAGLIKGDTANG